MSFQQSLSTVTGQLHASSCCWSVLMLRETFIGVAGLHAGRDTGAVHGRCGYGGLEGGGSAVAFMLPTYILTLADAAGRYS